MTETKVSVQWEYIQPNYAAHPFRCVLCSVRFSNPPREGRNAVKNIGGETPPVATIALVFKFRRMGQRRGEGRLPPFTTGLLGGGGVSRGHHEVALNFLLRPSIS